MDVRLKECAGIEDAGTRLKCFDDLTGRTVPDAETEKSKETIKTQAQPIPAAQAVALEDKKDEKPSILSNSGSWTRRAERTLSSSSAPS
jgi:hypothetical protein